MSNDVTDEEIAQAREMRAKREQEAAQAADKAKLALLRMQIAAGVAGGLADNPAITNESVAIRSVDIADHIIRLCRGEKPRETVATHGSVIDPRQAQNY
jgi:hypothetical protein